MAQGGHCRALISGMEAWDRNQDPDSTSAAERQGSQCHSHDQNDTSGTGVRHSQRLLETMALEYAYIEIPHPDYIRLY